jgi:hypothetical protein
LGVLLGRKGENEKDVAPDQKFFCASAKYPTARGSVQGINAIGIQSTVLRTYVHHKRNTSSIRLICFAH